MPMPSSDVIVIGGGVNGLACAARLSASGRKVVLLDSAPQVGGGAGEREFAPGFRAPALAHLTQGLDDRMVKGMALRRHGLEFHPPLATTILSADGDHLTVQGGRANGPDAAAWAALHAKLTSFA